MFLKNFSVFSLLLCSGPLFAQDGLLIDQQPVIYSDSVVVKLKQNFTDYQEISDKVSAYQITYLSDGLKIKGYVVVPKIPGKYPCIIYNRGGNREFGKLDESDYGYFMAMLASWGYIVAGSQYRGNAGSEGKEEFGGKDVDDVLNLIPLFSKIQFSDTSRIGMYGVSRGGMMTYLALERTKKMKAAVVISGITDLVKLLDTRPNMETNVYAQIIPGYGNRKTEVLRARSAVFFANDICKTTPILILQGTSDWRVPTNQVLDLVTALYNVKQPFRFSLFEGGAHGVPEYLDEANRQTKLFLNDYLRDGRPWPSLEVHGN